MLHWYGKLSPTTDEAVVVQRNTSCPMHVLPRDQLGQLKHLATRTQCVQEVDQRESIDVQRIPRDVNAAASPFIIRRKVSLRKLFQWVEHGQEQLVMELQMFLQYSFRRRVRRAPHTTIVGKCEMVRVGRKGLQIRL